MVSKATGVGEMVQEGREKTEGQGGSQGSTCGTAAGEERELGGRGKREGVKSCGGHVVQTE